MLFNDSFVCLRRNPYSMSAHVTFPLQFEACTIPNMQPSLYWCCRKRLQHEHRACFSDAIGALQPALSPRTEIRSGDTTAIFKPVNMAAVYKEAEFRRKLLPYCCSRVIDLWPDATLTACTRHTSQGDSVSPPQVWPPDPVRSALLSAHIRAGRTPRQSLPLAQP